MPSIHTRGKGKKKSVNVAKTTSNTPRKDGIPLVLLPSLSLPLVWLPSGQAVGGLRPSLADRLRMEVARDMLALAGRASDEAFDAEAPQFASIPSVPFRLPDGTEVGWRAGAGSGQGGFWGGGGVVVAAWLVLGAVLSVDIGCVGGGCGEEKRRV